MLNFDEQLEVDAQKVISMIYTDLYALEVGMRECCMHQVSAEIWDRVLKYLKDYFSRTPLLKDYKVNYKYYSIRGKLSDYYEVFIYKYPHQLRIYEVIENANENNIGNKRMSYILEWMLAKLLGYSSESSEEYLGKYPLPNVDILSNL